MGQLDQATLEALAGKYVWWKTPADAAARPERVIAQVMNIGEYSDIQLVAESVGNDALKEILTHAEIGQFSPKSWTYWHYRLGVVPPNEKAPQMPTRNLG